VWSGRQVLDPKRELVRLFLSLAAGTFRANGSPKRTNLRLESKSTRSADVCSAMIGHLVPDNTDRLRSFSRRSASNNFHGASVPVSFLRNSFFVFGVSGRRILCSGSETRPCCFSPLQTNELRFVERAVRLDWTEELAFEERRVFHGSFVRSSAAVAATLSQTSSRSS